MLNITKEATLVFKPEEVQVLLAGLGKLPYEVVAQLVNSLEKQLVEQFGETPE
jgi:hypothetical protein